VACTKGGTSHRLPRDVFETLSINQQKASLRSVDSAAIKNQPVAAQNYSGIKYSSPTRIASSASGACC
jgi:hypothetical protein